MLKGDKRGQGLSINTIILLILGILILVFLILGFTMGWNKLSSFLSGKNVDIISQSCQTACATNSIYDYCSLGRDLIGDDGKLTGVTCYFLAYGPNTEDGMKKYGIQTCPSLKAECDKTVVLGETCAAADTGKDLQKYIVIDKILDHSTCP